MITKNKPSPARSLLLTSTVFLLLGGSVIGILAQKVSPRGALLARLGGLILTGYCCGIG